MTKTFQVTFEINFQRSGTISNKWIYRQTSNISDTLVGNEIFDDSDVGLSAVLQLHLSRLNTWLQMIGQRQKQGKKRNI